MRWQRETSTADLLVEFCIPLATTALVVSVVFYMIDMVSGYHSMSDGMLRYVFFLYVFGVVHINRVAAIFKGYGTGRKYGLAMGIVMMLFVMVANGGWVLQGIVAIVWIIADRLTQSCSFENDQIADAGEGMVHATFAHWRRQQAEKKKTVKTDVSPYTGKKKHPGRAVAYFAFLALPMFVAGRYLRHDIPPEVERRLMVYTIAYIASSLILMMLTSYSGLRRYFHSRRTNIPGHIGMFWLVTGTAIVGLAIAAARIMPMPEPATETARHGKLLGTPAVIRSVGPKVGIQESANPNGARDEQFKESETGPRRIPNGNKRGGEQPVSGKDVLNLLVKKMASGSNLANALIAVAAIMVGIVLIPLLFAGLIGAVRVTKNRFGSFIRWCPRMLRRMMEVLGLVRVPKVFMPRREKRRRKTEPVRPVVNIAAGQYPDPFANNRAAAMTPDELVEYTYSALVARGQDLGIRRELGQTEYEFLKEYANLRPDMIDAARTLTEMHLYTEFSPGTAPSDWRPWLQQFWTQLV
ncbi:MAG: DUF4129 domain-containing protein [Candidatus Hydrogenedentes bacterium]|nr:DUF4129 domain-containing protein [Candidatus Hydrogenedentota bacterium]